MIEEDNGQSKQSASGFKNIQLAVESVLEYVDFVSKYQNGRLDSSKAFVIQSGDEPLVFQAAFPIWQDRVKTEWPSNLLATDAYKLIKETTYSLENILTWASSKGNLPFGVDPESLEVIQNFNQ